jgi:hypothetical protein
MYISRHYWREFCGVVGRTLSFYDSVAPWLEVIDPLSIAAGRSSSDEVEILVFGALH